MKTDYSVAPHPVPPPQEPAPSVPLEAHENALRVTPFPFLLLGIVGVLPIFAGAIAVWILSEGYRIEAQRWLLYYAALTLAYVGAMHCAIAMLERAATVGVRLRATLWSGIPLLAAWVALYLGARKGLALILLMLLLQLIMDKRLAERALLPRWYLPLRAVLTGAAAIALGFALLFHA